MTDRGRRLGKGIAIALAVHIVAAALLGILGYRFTQRPPQILEVTLGGGGGGGAEKMAAGKHLFSHDHSPFMRIAKLWQSLHSKWDLPCMLWQALQSFSPR